MSQSPSFGVYKVLAGCAIVAGAGGMGLSFLSMACAELPEIVAGVGGFVAGAVLVGSGVVALALLALASTLAARDAGPPSADDEL